MPVAADGSGPDGGGDPAGAGRDRLLPLPGRRPVGRFIGYLHIKDVLPLVDDPDAVVDLAMVRPLPRVPASLPLPDALSRLRRNNSHLALVTDDDGVIGDGGAGGPGRGPCRRRARRDAPCLSVVLERARLASTASGCTANRVDDFCAPHRSAGAGR